MKKEIYDLRVNSLINPLGVDDAPLFSWKMKSSEDGAMQTAYRIIVSENADFNELIWDSAFVKSDKSYGIKYAGAELDPERAYFWRVIVLDEIGVESASKTAYFETGLMREDLSGWSGAQWIGSPKKTYNTGGIRRYRFSVNFIAPDGECGVALAARNRDNYFLFDINMEKRAVRIFEYNDNAWAGSYASGIRPYRAAIGKENGYEIPKSAILPEKESDNQLVTEVDTSKVTLSINGEKIINEKNLIPEAKPFTPYKQRMFLFGFKQESGTAIYDNLKLEALDGEPALLIDDGFDGDYTNCSYLGEVKDGKLIVKNRFSLTCASPAINVRKRINLTGKVKSARLYAAAKGVYDIFINGEKVNKSFYDPGFTDYHMRIQYQTYDVTDKLTGGECVIGATVGNGYYSGFLGYNRMPMIYGNQNSFLAKLVVKYENGNSKIFVTDSSWQFTDCGPIIYDDYLNGEIYDARRSLDWHGADSPIWGECGIVPDNDLVSPANGIFLKPPRCKITAQTGPRAEVYRRIKAEYIGESPAGHFVYDLGQNIAGTVNIRVRGSAGTAIKLRYAEMCYRSGEVYLRNLRAAYNTDIYVLNGSADGEEYTPSFTSHGFRYIEVSGDNKPLNDNSIIISVEGLAITNTPEIAGGFQCSDSRINQLYSNIVWGQIGNSLLVYTDCPQRNERMGWTGDAQIFSRTAAYNINIRAFMDKWLKDIADAQLRFNMGGAVPDTAPLGGDNRGDACSGWGDAAVIIPWEMYRAYGDTKILDENYHMMSEWIEYIMSPKRRCNGIRTVNGFSVPDKSDISREPYIQVQQRRGDHLTFDESTPFILTATAYSARVLTLMSRIAEILGKHGDSKKYAGLFEKVKRAFNDAWVKEDGSIAYWGEMSKDGINEIYYSESSENRPSQTAYAVAIRFGLIDPDKITKAGNFLRAAVERAGGHLTTGFLGVSHLNPALTLTGNADTAYSLLLQDENPSWLYSVKNGATTVWERWDSYIAETDNFGAVSMNSFNHYSYGVVAEWLFESVLGIAPLEAGYKKIKIAPVIDSRLSYARGYHDSPYGRIESAWEINGKAVKLKCAVPPNTTALIDFGGITREVKSGEYEFVSDVASAAI